MISSGVFSRQFIGRARELAYLFERANLTALPGGCIVVRGEAGLGKTRLVEELAARVTHERGTKVVRGTTRVYANRPYAAIHEALSALGLELPPVAADLRFDGRGDWFESVAALLRAAATNPGVIIVLEDLHWADVATIELLRFCAGRLRETPILFIATYRTDDIENDTARARAFTELERDIDVVTLQPLSPGQTEHLVRTVVADLGVPIAPSVIAEVRELAEGRPLFAEELLRGVIERLSRDDASGPLVPTSIRASVRERFVLLSEAGRELLMSASLFGRRFSVNRLQRMTRIEPAAIFAVLRRARELQLIIEDPSDPGGDAFAFRHALMREAIYAEMLRAEVRIRHAEIAALYLEEPTINIAAIAEHTWQAGAGENAAVWNERAGDEASAVFAFGAAARAYERAWRSTSDPARRARVAGRAAEAVYHTADLLEAARWFGEAAGALTALGDHHHATRATLQRTRILTEASRHDEALREAEILGSSEAASPYRFEIETKIAGMLLVRENWGAALERLERAEQYRANADPAIASGFAATYALALMLSGAVDRARTQFVETVDVAREGHQFELLARTFNNWANLELNYGSIARARELNASGLAQAAEMKHVRHIALLLHNSAIIEIAGGDLSAADQVLARIGRLEHGIASLQPWRYAASVRLCALRGNDDPTLLHEATLRLEDAFHDDDRAGAAMLSAALAYRAAFDGDAMTAARLVQRAADLIDLALVPFWLLDAASRFGRPEERARARSRLAERAERGALTPARGFLLLDESREATRRRRRDEATRCAIDAAEAFGAVGWRLDQATALEAAGKISEGVAILRESGATADVARLTERRENGHRRGDATLTSREREIATLLLDGRTAKGIGESLTISERTVETHVASIYRKLGVVNRQELARFFRAPPSSR